jgi:hypothetical protein
MRDQHRAKLPSHYFKNNTNKRAGGVVPVALA